MAMFGGAAKKMFSFAKLEKRVFDPEKMSVEDISVPVCLRNLDIDTTKSLIEQEIKTYKSLDYHNKPLDQLKVYEYHSYQIGLVLRCLQSDIVLFNPKIGDVLPTAATFITKKQLHLKVFDIVYRYDNAIPSDTLANELIADIRWSPLDMAYLLYYLTLENRVIPKKN
jgi:hypothetical protein